MKFGYARVSTEEQNLNLQIDALKSVGCEKIFTDKESGVKFNRVGLEELMKALRAGDTLVIWQLDRLGRSIVDLIRIVNEFKNIGVNFICIKDNIDTTTVLGEFTFHLFAALAELERGRIRERTKAGLESARARGRLGGRPKGLSIEAKNKAIAAASLYNEGKLTVVQIAKQLNISVQTLYRYLQHQGVKMYKERVEEARLS